MNKLDFDCVCMEPSNFYLSYNNSRINTKMLSIFISRWCVTTAFAIYLCFSVFFKCSINELLFQSWKTVNYIKMLKKKKKAQHETELDHPACPTLPLLATWKNINNATFKCRNTYFFTNVFALIFNTLFKLSIFSTL